MPTSLANRFLGLFGLEMRRRRTANPSPKVPAWKVEEILAEFQSTVRGTQLPELPEKDGRLALLTHLQGISINEALWLIDALHSTLRLPGDVCEFGVAAGTTSALLANEILDSEKNLWLFDSFEGLPQPTARDELIDDFWDLGSIEAYAGKMSFPESEVRTRLGSIGFPNDRSIVVPGFIEETIQASPLPQSVCFALIDFDFYEPIRVALEFLQDTLAPGGLILVDDYGYFSSGAQAAVDEFLAENAGEFSLSKPPAWAGHFVVLSK